ncbi:MAG: hypothetical protein JPMHGGIA_00749 [Saprospiraceae bacterium]|nr:hypothetical protein [Saprospiraceae bacterium]
MRKHRMGLSDRVIWYSVEKGQDGWDWQTRRVPLVREVVVITVLKNGGYYRSIGP